MVGRAALAHRRPFLRTLAAGLLCAALLPAGRALAQCPDYLLSEDELSEILDGTFGLLGAFVVERSVRVEPQNNACYLQMQVTVSVPLLIPECTAAACSTGIARDRQIGIRGFSISGCDDLFDFTGAPRSIQTSYADVSERIRAHCGSDGYRIARVLPDRTAAGGVVRLILAPAP